MYTTDFSIEVFLDYLKDLNIKLSANGSKLKCSAPPGVVTRDIQAEISSCKAEILAYLADADSKSTAIERVHRDGYLPLSSAQSRLWILDKIEPDSAAYNEPKAIRLLGDLNLSSLEKSLTEIAQRHEVLRTVFRTIDGQVSQVILPISPITLEIKDLRPLPEDEKESSAAQLMLEDAHQSFNLTEGPLFRSFLIQLSDTEHILMLNFHHIIFDGWSFKILFEEISCLYNSFLKGQPSPLDPLQIQYADFAHWQQQWLDSADFQSQLNYWKQKLGNATHVLELPTDYARPPIQRDRGATISQDLPSRLKEQLIDLSQQEDSTLFMTLLTGFKILCHRFTAQESITVGSPIAGRNSSAVEQLIGFFVSSLVLNTDLSGNPSCRQLLRRVRRSALDAYSNQGVPFEKLVEELRPERDLSRTPLFQVWFNMLNLDLGENSLNLDNLEVKPFSDNLVASKFDLTLYILETAEGLSIQWVYNTNLFKPSTIEYWGRCFQTLLENMVAQPNCEIATIPLVAANDRSRRTLAAAQTSPENLFTAFERREIEQSIGSRFDAQARQYADRIAIKTEQYEWTYGQLASQANQIANTILTLQPNEVASIALLFEQDAPMIAGLLGALKTGRAYVPLDSQYPTERLRYMLSDSQANIILTNSQTLGFAQQLVADDITVINVDTLLPSTPSTPPNLLVSPQAVAYILYTSGSTGQPKGVVQNHRNVIHFIRNQTNQLGVTIADRQALLASYCSDAAVVDIFTALLNGASLHLFNIKAEGVQSLSQWIEMEQITIFHSTPTLYRSFVDCLFHDPEGAKQQLSGVRAAVLGGEKSCPSDVRLHHQFFAAECLFVNLYGSTESTISLQYLCDRDASDYHQTVPVGYPIDDTEIMLLNDAGLDAQVYGEIAVRSEHLALGYWQRPELTQQAFLSDPDGGDCRIYRTGDIGRLRADGMIDVLERKDFQVKLRGFRIEPGEIESALCQHPHIQKAAVIKLDDESSSDSVAEYLAAYVVLQAEHQIEAREVRQRLQKVLPDYMVPSFVVPLDAFPLTPSGKLDRRALPKPQRPALSPGDAVLPKDQLEQRLLSIWKQILPVEEIQTTDDFFELGGHSLVAVKLFAEIEKEFGKKLPLATLFQAKTVAEIAEIIRQKNWLAPWDSLVPIKTEGSKPPLFYMHAGGGNLLVYRDLALSLGDDQPVYGLQARGLDGNLNRENSIPEMAEFYISQIRSVQPKGPYHLAGLSTGGLIAWEIARQFEKQGDTVGLLAMFDSPGPGYPELRPLVPRIASVVSWMGQDMAKRVIQAPVKLVREARLNGVNSAFELILKRLNLAQSEPDDDAKMVKAVVNRQINEKLEQYRERVSETKRNSLEELANIAITALLRKSSKPYYANTFTNGLFLKSKQGMTDELQDIRLANFQARMRYVPEPYSGRAILFRASERPPGIRRDPMLGWAGLAGKGFEVYEIVGSHTSIVGSPALASKLRVCLERIQDELQSE